MDLKKTYAPIFEVNFNLRIPSMSDSPEDLEEKTEKTAQSREESLGYEEELENQIRTASEDLLSLYSQPSRFAAVLKRILSGEAKGRGRSGQQRAAAGSKERNLGLSHISYAMLAYLLRGNGRPQTTSWCMRVLTSFTSTHLWRPSGLLGFPFQDEQHLERQLTAQERHSVAEYLPSICEARRKGKEHRQSGTVLLMSFLCMRVWRTLLKYPFQTGSAVDSRGI